MDTTCRTASLVFIGLANDSVPTWEQVSAVMLTYLSREVPAILHAYHDWRALYVHQIHHCTCYLKNILQLWQPLSILHCMQETLLWIAVRNAGHAGSHQLLEAGFDMPDFGKVDGDEVTLGIGFHLDSLQHTWEYVPCQVHITKKAPAIQHGWQKSCDFTSLPAWIMAVKWLKQPVIPANAAQLTHAESAWSLHVFCFLLFPAVWNPHPPSSESSLQEHTTLTCAVTVARSPLTVALLCQ